MQSEEASIILLQEHGLSWIGGTIRRNWVMKKSRQSSLLLQSGAITAFLTVWMNGRTVVFIIGKQRKALGIESRWKTIYGSALLKKNWMHVLQLPSKR